MPDPWTHHTMKVNGFRMHFVVAGSGYPLVFLHGWPQTWYEWRKIIPPGLGRNGGKIDRQAARRLWHVLFHAGIPDLAETLVSTNVEAYLSYFYTSTAYNYSPAVFTKEDVAEYVRVYSSPGALRAGFQYSSTALREDLENLSGCARKFDDTGLGLGRTGVSWQHRARLAGRCQRRPRR